MRVGPVVAVAVAPQRCMRERHESRETEEDTVGGSVSLFWFVALTPLASPDSTGSPQALQALTIPGNGW